MIILGVSSFLNAFGDEGSATVMKLSISTILMLILSFFSVKMHPCLINSVNLFEISGCFIIVVINICGLLIIYTGSSYLGLFLAIGLTLIILVSTYIIYKKYYYSGEAMKKQF